MSLNFGKVSTIVFWYVEILLKKNISKIQFFKNNIKWSCLRKTVEADVKADKNFLNIIIGKYMVISRSIMGDGINSLYLFIHEKCSFSWGISLLLINV